jgi:SpoVK/Ycf46/Vps4 family AAA+-type ATPase
LAILGADIGALSSSAYAKALERKLLDIRSLAEKDNEIQQKQLKSLNFKDKKQKFEGNSEEKFDSNDNNESKLSIWSLSTFINKLSKSELLVTVNTIDFMSAVKDIRPSVSKEELKHYEAIGKEFSDIDV